MKETRRHRNCRGSRPFWCALVTALPWLPIASELLAADPLEQTVQSPDGLVRATLHSEPGARPTCRISWQGVEFARVALGLRLVGSTRGDGLKLVSSRRSSRDESYTVPVGKSSRCRDRHESLVAEFVDGDDPTRHLGLELRAFDGALAFRYTLPKEKGLEEFHVLDELTELSFAGEPRLRAVPLADYTTSYEAHYLVSKLSEAPGDRLLALPVLLETQRQDGSALWCAVTEAGLEGWAGAYLARTGLGSLSVRLSPLPGREDGVLVIGKTPAASPWRAIFVGENPGRFLESDVVFHLNAPCAIADTSWIRTGRTAFPWWNGYALTGVGFEPGMNTATHEYWIDFCAEQGIEMHSLDGTHLAWYGGPIVPEGPTDVTTGIEGLDVPRLFEYAKKRRVRLRLWTHWKALRPQIDEALPLYRRWGAEGIMVDFMDRDDQEMVAFYHEVARKAAAHRLTVSFHGSYKPTGMGRTWPNVLTWESALNQEYDKWDAKGTPPSHNVDVALVRMIAGPLDYHQGGMRHVRPEDYKPRYAAPFVQGTRAHQLAMYVVYQNHLPMLVDTPAAYRGQPGLRFLVDVPVTWDETRVLIAEPERCVAIARRSGASWYLGVLNGDGALERSLPLSFLGEGGWKATWYEDARGGSDPAAVRERSGKFRSSDELNLRLAPGGGLAGTWLPAEI